MRLGQVGPVFFGMFVALACGSKDDESKVNPIGSAATGNMINTGNTGNTGSGNTGNTGSGNTGNTAGSGTIDTGNGASTGNPGGGQGSVGDPMCASISADGQPTQVDLYFMVDSTGSMNCPVPDGGVRCDMVNGPPASGESRWTVVTAALKAFVADPQNQGLGVGLRFFPVVGNGGGPMGGTASCNVTAYATPNVEIGPLSTTSAALTTAINMQMPSGGTPTVPSLTAAIDHATAWAKANPTHRVAVVYATDGQPTGCTNNTVPNAAAVALRGALATPSIPTYVLGVGPDLANLNSIAENGGTKAAFLVDTSQNAATQLSAALASIRTTTALDCTYTIPPPPAGQMFEKNQVNIEYTDGAGAVTKVGPTPKDPATGKDLDCATSNGWQYSADSKQINLCGKTCTDVKADKGGKIQVLFGCPTMPEEPPT